MSAERTIGFSPRHENGRARRRAQAGETRAEGGRREAPKPPAGVQLQPPSTQKPLQHSRNVWQGTPVGPQQTLADEAWPLQHEA